MPAEEPDDGKRAVPATTNEVKGSSVGTLVQAGTIHGKIKVLNLHFSTIGFVLVCAAVAVVLVAGLLWLPPGRPESGTGAHPPQPPGIVLQKVSHAFSPELDRVAVFVHNPATEAVPLANIDLYLDFDARNWWHDPSDQEEWHFEVGSKMFLGPQNREGETRLHGTVRAAGTQFDLPLIGQGFVAEDGSWRRLLTFSTQAVLPAGQTTEVTIDLPAEFPVKAAGSHNGELKEVHFDPTRGSLFTHVLMRTPSSVSHACDFVRRNPDPALCDTVDPAAMVTAPR
ncbi:hypothetical protein Q5425_27625 [Amycolatopsis sp. A133]|uniref:hypothetical protein n=1 Tax=Amycolatopsis sp. A133 TaxID=3064472 RepID=UPI0027E68B61|nr:hypothetical protein [Amycolatopsis sp. A133]MDQ7807524.1 hypothetical protein [Amycolatopsis sp. A133]